MAAMTATLAEITEHKRLEVSSIMGDRSLADLRAEVEAQASLPAPRDFFGAITSPNTRGPGPVAIIAEIKRRSPSAGLIRPEYAGTGFAPERIARRYADHGASAISCLTDEKFFGGEGGFISRVKAACDLPVLRKDFLIDLRQVWESRLLGADAVLLIAECLPGDELRAMADEAAAAGLAVLIEIHDEGNLERAVGLVLGGPPLRGGPGTPTPGGMGTPTVPGGGSSFDASSASDLRSSPRSGDSGRDLRASSKPSTTRPPGTVGVPGRLLGINNRNLATMTTDLAHTLRLAAAVPAETRPLLVSESGIRRREDLDALAAAGIGAALVGESLMREEDPGEALGRLLRPTRP